LLILKPKEKKIASAFQKKYFPANSLLRLREFRSKKLAMLSKKLIQIAEFLNIRCIFPVIRENDSENIAVETTISFF